MPRKLLYSMYGMVVMVPPYNTMAFLEAMVHLPYGMDSVLGYGTTYHTIPYGTTQPVPSVTPLGTFFSRRRIQSKRKTHRSHGVAHVTA